MWWVNTDRGNTDERLLYPIEFIANKKSHAKDAKSPRENLGVLCALA